MASMQTKTFCRIGLALLLVAGIGAAMVLLPGRAQLARFLQQIDSVGPWGPVLLAAVYAGACVLFVPGSILTLGAGFLFGVVTGNLGMPSGRNFPGWPALGMSFCRTAMG